MAGSDSKRSRALAVLALACGVAAAPAAEARSLTVRWRFPAPERAAGFRVHVGSAPGLYTHTIDVGKPVPDAAGVFQAQIEVADHEPAFLAVSAYGERGEESPRSNEVVRAPASEPAPPAAAESLGAPGQPRVVRP